MFTNITALKFNKPNSEEKTVLNVKTRNRKTTTKRYKFISTEKMVQFLTSTGWVLDGIQYTKDKVYGKHLITLSHPLYSNISNEEILKIHVLNSHNGETSTIPFFGLFRLICKNGLMIGRTQFEFPHIRHIGDCRKKVITALNHLQNHIPELSDNLKIMKSVKLSPSRQIQYITLASNLREVKPHNVYDLLDIRRNEDRESTLWNIYNRVQESLVNGLYKYEKTEKVLVNGNSLTKTSYVKARKISGIDNTVKLNQSLWDLTKQFINKGY